MKENNNLYQQIHERVNLLVLTRNKFFWKNKFLPRTLGPSNQVKISNNKFINSQPNSSYIKLGVGVSGMFSANRISKVLYKISVSKFFNEEFKCGFQSNN